MASSKTVNAAGKTTPSPPGARKGAKTPTGRPSKRHATPKSFATHEAILEAAITCIAETGFHRTNASAVAKVAGVTRGRLQYYYPTTEDLMAAAARHVVRRWDAEYSRAMADAPKGGEPLVNAVRLYLQSADNQYFQAWVELLAAARTEPWLKPLLMEAARAFEASRSRIAAAIFTDPDAGLTAAVRTTSDLVRVVAIGSVLNVFPTEAEARRQALADLAITEMLELWRMAGLKAR